MEPNFKLLLDEMTSLNRRFDEQGDQWGRGFSDLQRGLTDLERGLTDRSTSINFRLDALEASQSVNSDALAHRIAVLESASMGSANTAMVSRLATLEASYTDRDAKFTNRISELEALRVSPTKDDRDRVVTIEAATADLTSWRPGVEGMLDDVCIAVRKLEKSRERELFDEMSHGPGLLPTPTKAVVHFSAGFPAEPPVMGAPRRFDYTGFGIRGRHDLDPRPGQWNDTDPQIPCCSFICFRPLSSTSSASSNFSSSLNCTPSTVSSTS
jgi:hypothetical protein